MKDTPQQIVPKRRRGKFLSQWQLFSMLLPAFILVFIFSYLPLAGWILAFNHYQVGRGLLDAKFVGLDHFKMFFVQSKDFGYLLRNTLSMNFMILILGILLAMIFAVLVNEISLKSISKTIQTVSFFPYFLSWVIVYSIAYAFFAPSGGAITTVLQNFGLLAPGTNILGSNDYAWVLAVGLQIWKSLGYNSVIFLSAISSISPEQYESATVDGANRFQKIVHITVPNLIPTMSVLLILNAGWILNSNFDFYFIFTNPTNWGKMEVLDMYIYNFGLKQSNYSYATAIGMVKTLTSVSLLLFVNWFSKRTMNRSIF